MKKTASEKIGAVFTPLPWAKFGIKKFGIFQKWLDGIKIFDPTMGNGNLLAALVLYGIEQGYSISELPIKSLYGNEINTSFFRESLSLFQKNFGIDMSDNFTNSDILLLPPKSYDLLFGNPPWKNFVDIPENYKQKIKSDFLTYDLIDNKKNLLLGNSRIDIAALIIQKTIAHFLKPYGNAIFFLPLSLLLNDGAHKNFRKFKIHDIPFALKKVYDFNDLQIFKNIKTRYGLICFQRNKRTIYPIRFYRHENGIWQEYLGKPLINHGDPISILAPQEINILKNFKPIKIKKESIPRQGINTCGANNIFFFNSFKKLNNGSCLLNNEIILPEKFIYPLLTAKNFKENIKIPYQWVLLPYNKNGKPLTEEQIKKIPNLENYLLKNKKKLTERKGTLIKTQIQKNIWWAMLGVGKYNFAPYKIVWEAYGKKKFHPLLITNKWQVNQSLQAYIPVWNKEEAQEIFKLLQNPIIETYLLSLKMGNTMNWAQPGKIKKLLIIDFDII